MVRSVVICPQWSTQTLFVVDSMPLPACKRVRAKRCKKAQGPAFWGYCAAKDEYYFGWKVHLICDIQGLPITFDILPAACHELMLLQHLLAALPPQSWVLADQGYNSDAHEQAAYGLNQIRLIPKTLPCSGAIALSLGHDNGRNRRKATKNLPLKAVDNC